MSTIASEEYEDDASDSEDDDGDDQRDPNAPRTYSANSAGRKRRNVLPRVLRGQRCGHCHTCLNPQVPSIHAFIV